MTAVLRLAILALALLTAAACTLAVATATAPAAVRQAEDEDPCDVDDPPAGCEAAEDPCEDLDAPDSCFGEELPTAQDYVDVYYDEVVGPAIYSALGKALAGKVTGKTIEVGSFGPYPVNTRIAMELEAADYTAAKGVLDLAAGKTGALVVTLTRKARATLRKRGRIKAEALLDLTNDTYDGEWGDSQDVVIKGVKKKKRR